MAASAQLITLVLIASTGNGATSQRLGEFYDMDACRAAANHAALVDATGDVRLSFACVPLTPVASSSLLPNRR